MPTRLAYRQAAIRALGTLHTGTADAASTTGLLVLTTWPFKSTVIQNERFEHWVIHRPDAASATDRVRTVPNGGYDPITGGLTPDNTWTNAPDGEAVEVFGAADPDTVHRLINDALKLIPVSVEFTFTPVTAQARRHSLAAVAPWLTDPDDVYQVGYLSASDARSDVDPFGRPVRGTVYERRGVVYLEGFSQPTDATVYVLARRSAYTYCTPAAGVFGDQSGLSLETDQAAVEEDVVAAGVKMLYWDAAREELWPGDLQTAELKVAQAAARFWALVGDYWREPSRSFVPLARFGTVGYGARPF